MTDTPAPRGRTSTDDLYKNKKVGLGPGCVFKVFEIEQTVGTVTAVLVSGARRSAERGGATESRRGDPAPPRPSLRSERSGNTTFWKEGDAHTGYSL